jgi:hypothetical protein
VETAVAVAEACWVEEERVEDRLGEDEEMLPPLMQMPMAKSKSAGLELHAGSR